MASLLQYTSTQVGVDTMNVTQLENRLAVSGLSSDSNPLRLGSYLEVTGFANVAIVEILVADDSGNGTYKVDTYQSSEVSGTALVTEYQISVQDALNLFLQDGPSASGYYLVIASMIDGINSINAANPSYGFASGVNGVRILATTDDGTPILDTSKCVTYKADDLNQITSLVTAANPGVSSIGNIYVNFTNKIKTIVNTNVNNNNQDTLTDASGNKVVVTMGTAGGNSINENHQSRPELLGALFKDSGIAYSRRYSSSTNSFNYYMAQRMGISSEENLGSLRLNVPTYFAGVIGALSMKSEQALKMNKLLRKA
jgi:hypothetical protein